MIPTAVAGILCAVSATAETRNSSFGFYAAPTSHHVTSGTELETIQSSTSLDFALFYTRFFSRAAIRVEARYSSREYVANFETSLFPGAYLIQPMQEEFLELPLILHVTNVVSLGEPSLRISIGGGVYYAILLSQDFSGGSSSIPDAPEALDAGGYSRYGWIGDGGASLIFRPDRAMFMNFRLQDDLGLSGEPEQSIAREDAAFGFYAGFEWLF